MPSSAAAATIGRAQITASVMRFIGILCIGDEA
jgi:hypothetical protein